MQTPTGTNGTLSVEGSVLQIRLKLASVVESDTASKYSLRDLIYISSLPHDSKI